MPSFTFDSAQLERLFMPMIQRELEDVKQAYIHKAVQELRTVLQKEMIGITISMEKTLANCTPGITVKLEVN